MTTTLMSQIWWNMLELSRRDGPRIIFYDLEVSRELVEGYRQKYDFKVVKTLRYQELMAFAWKEKGKRKIHYVSRNHFKKYRDFVKKLADVMSLADIRVAYNGDNFDEKMANTFFIREGVDMPPPIRTVDPCKVARSRFKIPDNKLNTVAEFFGLGSKEKITYADIETEFMTKPNSRVERLMKKYVTKDVELLEKVYDRMLPYMKNHPNVAVYSKNSASCPKCGGTNTRWRGYTYTNTSTYRRFKCFDEGCLSWSQVRVQEKGQTKPLLQNV